MGEKRLPPAGTAMRRRDPARAGSKRDARRVSARRWVGGRPAVAARRRVRAGRSLACLHPLSGVPHG